MEKGKDYILVCNGDDENNKIIIDKLKNSGLNQDNYALFGVPPSMKEYYPMPIIHSQSGERFFGSEGLDLYLNKAI